MPDVLKTSLLNGTNGFTLLGENAKDVSGFDVSGAGDLNGDGIDDVVVTAWGASRTDGKTYVVFGKGDGASFDTTINLADLNGTNGFSINPNGTSLIKADAIGDV